MTVALSGKPLCARFATITVDASSSVHHCLQRLAAAGSQIGS